MIVGIDFRKFLRVTHIESLLVVLLDDDKNGQSRNGFSASSRYYTIRDVESIQARFWAEFSSKWAQKGRHKRTAAWPWLSGGPRSWTWPKESQAQLVQFVLLQAWIEVAKAVARWGGAGKRTVEWWGGWKTPRSERARATRHGIREPPGVVLRQGGKASSWAASSTLRRTWWSLDWVETAAGAVEGKGSSGEGRER